MNPLEDLFYLYYSTQRPIDIATFPNASDNPPLFIKNYDSDRRTWVEAGTILAWGELAYAKPLTEKQQADYELTPSRKNPDVQKEINRQAQIVGAWEIRNNIPDTQRITWWHNHFGEFVLKEFVSRGKLAERCRFSETHPVLSNTRRKTLSLQHGGR